VAIAYDVNIGLGSQMGFTLPADARLSGYAPDIRTTLTLDGVSIPYTGANSLNSSPLLVISASATLDNVPPSDFIFSPYQTSTYQVLYLKNKGNDVLTIDNVIATYSAGIEPVMNFNDALPPLTIQPGAQLAVSGAYYATEAGAYDNYFIFQSNSSNGWVRLKTHQIVLDSQNFSTAPRGFTTATNRIGQVETVTYNLTPIFNNILTPDVGISVFGKITGSYGWRIINTGTNFITAQFNANDVNNVNGTYVSNLTIEANGASYVAINTATVTIDHDKNKNLSAWLSPASHYNSIIGISYDLDDDQRVVTIGVGMGGDGVPIYGSGGNIYLELANLGLGSDAVETPYAFWANVYKIRFTGEAKVYHSKDYEVKTTEGLNYAEYFGEHNAPGSMFIVEDDGYGSIKIEINHLRDFYTDVDEDLKATLQNLTRAFYYYSEADVLGRYYPTRPEYATPIPAQTTTRLFLGFDYNTRDKLAFVNVSIVGLPI